MGKLDLVILDLDGTLYSSTATTLGAVERAVSDLNNRHGLGLERPSNELILSGVGLTREEFAEKVFPTLATRYHEEVDDLVWHWERELVLRGRGSLFPGALEVIEALSGGYRLAVATNAGQGYMDHILDYFGIRGHFEDARCAGTEGTRLKSELLTKILGNLSVDPGRSVMVGDRRSDMEAAHDAGTLAIGGTWGFGSRTELADAGSVIDRFEDLPAAVEALS